MRRRESAVAEWTVAGAFTGFALAVVAGTTTDIRDFALWVAAGSAGLLGGGLLGFWGARLFSGR